MKWSDGLDHRRRAPVALNDGLDQWRERARRVRQNWTLDADAEALRAAYRDGIKRAAAFVEEQGQRDLATALRRLADERPAESSGDR